MYNHSVINQNGNTITYNITYVMGPPGLAPPLLGAAGPAPPGPPGPPPPGPPAPPGPGGPPPPGHPPAPGHPAPAPDGHPAPAPAMPPAHPYGAPGAAGPAFGVIHEGRRRGEGERDSRSKSMMNRKRGNENIYEDDHEMFDNEPRKKRRRIVRSKSFGTRSNSNNNKQIRFTNYNSFNSNSNGDETNDIIKEHNENERLIQQKNEIIGMEFNDKSSLDHTKISTDSFDNVYNESNQGQQITDLPLNDIKNENSMDLIINKPKIISNVSDEHSHKDKNRMDNTDDIKEHLIDGVEIFEKDNVMLRDNSQNADKAEFALDQQNHKFKELENMQMNVDTEDDVLVKDKLQNKDEQKMDAEIETRYVTNK